MKSLISHRRRARSFDAVLAEARRRAVAAGDQPGSSVTERLALLEQLCEFELGKFLLVHQGLNGYWTHYVVFVHPERRRRGGGAIALCELERFVLDAAPTMLATQERFVHFRRVVQEEVAQIHRAEIALASVPCGLMADLLSVDYPPDRTVHLHGFDLDEESLQHAAAFAAERGRTARFSRQDAWRLNLRRRFDVLVSNGLNLYEPDDARVTRLYARFAAALKPGGLLVTSFLTPPAEWDMTRVDSVALARQQLLFSDVIGARWQCFRSSELSRRQLADAGLTEIEIVPGRANIFPTALARAPQ